MSAQALARRPLPPLIEDERSVTPAVLAAMAETDEPRLRAITAALVRHLHAFVLEVQPTEDEYEFGLRWIAALGHHTNETNNEVVLAADVLGLSTLVDLINNDGGRGETMSALLGPFYRGHAPVCAYGETIARSATPGPGLWFEGRVLDVDGKPIENATLDIWQASPVGLYDNQDPAQDDYNLRGKFTTDAQGRFAFRSVKPAGYPVPTGGPVGKLLHAQKRHPYRPAHVHFIVSAPGHKTLITQIFSDSEEALATDVVFGAKKAIVGEFREHHEAEPERYADFEPPFFTCRYDFRLVKGEPTFPVPPIA
ncbi:MAG: dioxygenase [Pseudomonadota bacterium]